MAGIRLVLGVCAVLGCARGAAAQTVQEPASEPRDDLRDAPALPARPPLRTQALPSGAVKLSPQLRSDGGEDAEARTVRVPIALEGRTAEQQRDDTIKLTAGVGRITAAAAGAPTLELPMQGSVIVSSDSGRASAARSEIREGVKTPMPWLLIETRKRAGEREPEVRSARPFLTLAKAIAWDAAQQRHVAEFLFGLDPEQGQPGPLADDVVVRFSVTCDDVQPAAARVEHVGPDGYGTVRVRCSPKVKNERADHHIQVHAGHGNLRYGFTLPHRAGPPALRVSATRVLGLGFGSTVVTVQRREEDGSPLAADADAHAALFVEGGSLDTSTVALPRGRDSASIEVHPHGLGRIALTAELDGQRSAATSIDLAWPVLQVIAMIAGGLLGGVLSAFGPRRRKPARRAVEGALVGLLVTGVALVLPGFAALPGWARATELGLFVLAAVAGFVGTPLVDRAARALFPTLAESGSPARAPAAQD